MVEPEKGEPLPDITPSTGSQEESSAENAPYNPPKKASGYELDDDSFDHGWRAWLQVFAAWFLFVNTWYVSLSQTAAGTFNK